MRLTPTPFILFVAGAIPAMAFAEPAEFKCTILPGEITASVMVTNPLAREASCLVNCRFSTAKYGNDPEITCAKPVPPGKEVQMCVLRSGGEKILKLAAGHADCRTK